MYLCALKLLKVKNEAKREEFRLRLAGVADGKHSFSIVCDKTFFELAELSQLQDGQLDLQIEMLKTEKMLDLRFHFEGDVVTTCDRCLDDITINLNFDETLIVNLVSHPEEDFENDENIWMIDENAYDLDIFHFVYESIMLALPQVIMHSDDEEGNSTCNAEVLKRLEELSGTQNEDSEEIDPRWEALKNLKFDEE